MQSGHYLVPRTTFLLPDFSELFWPLWQVVHPETVRWFGMKMCNLLLFCFLTFLLLGGNSIWSFTYAAFSIIILELRFYLYFKFLIYFHLT